MTWQPPEPISRDDTEHGKSYYTLEQLRAVRREALQEAVDMLRDTKENTRYDCVYALENLIKELT